MSELHGGEPISPRLYEETDVASIKTARLSVGVFCALMAIAFSVCYAIVQPDVLLGFEQIRNCAAVSICLLLLPQGYRELHHWFQRSPQLKVGIDAIVTLSGLASLVGIQWLESYFSINLMPLLWVLATILLGLSLWRFIPLKLELQHWGAGVIVLALLAYLIWATWGTLTYMTPRPIAKLLAGNIHIDTLFHSSVAAMIQTYGIPSTGLNGPVYIPYHTFSHRLFAQFAPLVDLSVFQFYNIAYPVIILPLLFRSLLGFAVDLRSLSNSETSAQDLRRDWKFWGLLFLGFAGVLPTALMIQLNIYLRSNLVSQSHLLAVSLAFFTLSLCLWLLHQRNTSKRLFSNGLLILGISGLLSLVTLSKVSVGFVLFGTLFYTVLRLRLYLHWGVCVGMAIAIALQLAVLKSMGYLGGYPVSPSTPQLFAYGLKIDPAVRAFWLPVLLLWSLAYLTLRFKTLHLVNLADLVKAGRASKTVDAEIVVVTCCLGLLPGMLIDITGRAAYYFMDFQMWLSLSFLLGTAHCSSVWQCLFSSKPNR